MSTDTLLAHLKIKNKSALRNGLNLDTSGVYGGFLRDEVSKGVDFINRWLGEAEYVRPLTKIQEFKGRAHMTDTTAMIDTFDKAWVVVHELGHAIESANPYILEELARFYARRTKGQRMVGMKELYPNAGYDATERTKPDEFPNPYVGKFYTTAYPEFAPGRKTVDLTKGDLFNLDLPGAEHLYGTEILSMGLQYMHESPSLFALRDPDYFDFIAGLMSAANKRGKAAKKNVSGK
jgi:hypothetical protein